MVNANAEKQITRLSLAGACTAEASLTASVTIRCMDFFMAYLL
jgi:hypothetical protein